MEEQHKDSTKMSTSTPKSPPISASSICAHLPAELKSLILQQRPQTFRLPHPHEVIPHTDSRITERLNVVHPAHILSGGDGTASTACWLPDTPFYDWGELVTRFKWEGLAIIPEIRATTHLQFLQAGVFSASIARAICERTTFVFSRQGDLDTFMRDCADNGLGAQRIRHVGLRMECFVGDARFFEDFVKRVEDDVEFLPALKSVELTLRGTNMLGPLESDRYLRIRWLAAVAYRLKMARGVEISFRGTTYNSWGSKVRCEWQMGPELGWGTEVKDIWAEERVLEERDANWRFNWFFAKFTDTEWHYLSCWMYEWRVVVRKMLEGMLESDEDNKMAHSYF